VKITSVDIVQVASPDPGDYGIPWNPTIVRINTDEGIYGIGEIGLPMGYAAHGQVGLARDYAPLIIGMDPFQISAIWEKLYRKTFWAVGGGMLTFGVISAIDIALWDLKGKALGVPVYELLGGKTNNRLRSYASQIQFGWGPEMGNLVQPEEYADIARVAVAEGFDCVKVNPIGFDEQGRWMTWDTRGVLTNAQMRVTVDRVAAVREAVGDDVDIIVELHAHTDTNTAIQLAREIEQFRILYYEESTTPLNWKTMAKVANTIGIPIATGERLYSRFGFLPYIENQVVDIVQPDLGNCGGFTETRKICDMASTYDIGVQLHLIGSPVSTAAALQMEAVLPNFVIHEHNNTSLLPENIALCTYDYQPVGGYFQIPELPGIGQDLTAEAYKNASIVSVD